MGAVPGMSEEVSKLLFGLVTEFLQWHDFPLTLEAFATERKAKRKQASSSVCGKPLAGKERSSVCSALLRKFDDGKRDEFFALWQQYIPASMLARHADTHKAEFHLQIYFALYPILPKQPLSLSAASNATSSSPSADAYSSPSSRQELAQRMRMLKHYLETQGAGMAVSAELLPFYALPYVPHPEAHPSYQHMFHGQWPAQQRRSLKAFLEAIPGQDSATPPGLYVLYAQAVEAAQAVAAAAASEACTQAGSTSAVSPGAASNQQHQHAADGAISSRPVSALLKGQAELSDVIAAADSSGRYSNACHSSNGPHSAHMGAVLPLSAEYEAVHYGEPGSRAGAAGSGGAPTHDTGVDTSLSQEGVMEGLPPIQEASTDAADTVAAYALASAAADADEDTDAAADAYDEDTPGAGCAADGSADPTEQQQQNSTGAAGASQAQVPAAPVQPRLYHLAELPPLNYARVKAGLQSGEAQLVARLLQALRWRLTCCAAAVERFAVMTGWIEWDLLGMHDAPQGAASIAEMIMSSQDPAVLYQLARLLNAIASDRAGRAYLLQQCSHAVSLLLQLLNANSPQGSAGSTVGTGATGGIAGSITGGTAGGTGDTPLQQQALAALQKLSLKRRAQSAMIAQGAVEWVVAFLGSAAGALTGSAARAATTGANDGGGGSSRRASGAASGQGSAQSSANNSRRQSSSDATAAAGERADAATAYTTRLLAAADASTGPAGATAAAVAGAGTAVHLSDYSIEYGAALLMNLVLRRAGKARCEGCAVALLRVCIGLMESTNEQVRTYINGTLYATLSRASIRHAAAGLGLEHMLHDVATRSSPTFARQIDFILQQLSVEAHAGDLTARGGSEAAASDDDASPDGDAYADDDMDDACFEDADGDSAAAAEGLTGGSGGTDSTNGEATAEVTVGEALLASAYLAGPEEAKSELELMRASMSSCALAGDTSHYSHHSGCSGVVSTATAVRGSASFWGECAADAPLGRPITPAGAVGQHHGAQLQAVRGSYGYSPASGTYHGQLRVSNSNTGRADGTASKQASKGGSYAAGSSHNIRAIAAGTPKGGPSLDQAQRY